ncbi:MAG TPA: NADH-ubiquinone oxidoreductase-F iron-sulfur binding region domain-containing protein [Acidimicrobiales bacterium]|nr:NADH-ubiquinone oxidoreductase-F iron-sulfur binding region domain-containing protein [Acidimicrobiales bacterium]
MPTATTDPTAGTRSAGAGTSSSRGDDQVRPTLLAGWHAHRRADLAAHVAYHGAPPLPRRGDTSWAERFAGVVDASGLTGRGGAAFPSATKLGNVRSARGRPTLVVNAMEGEPASAKDKVLLSCVPHLVLDGAELAACALDAGLIVVCVPDAHDDTAAAVQRAVVERVGTGHAPVPVELVRPPGRYVGGEESALVSWLNGGPGAPTWRPDKRRPLAIGRGAALVHNAETLAHMALVARHGPASFRATGSPEAPGTSLVTVSGGVEHPGVYEIAMGTALGAIVNRARPTDDVKAVLTGGFGGSWVPAAALGTAYTPRAMAEVGGVVGAGVLVVLTRGTCGIAETARVARYMAGESAGQCGPCVFGLPSVADDLELLAFGTADPSLLARLEMRVAAVEGRGACRHPDGVARMVRSALAVFATDAAAHAARGPCAFAGTASVLPSITFLSPNRARAGSGGRA